MTIGQEWKRAREAKRVDKKNTEEERLREEADLAVAKIPDLVREALGKDADCVLALPRGLEPRDIAGDRLHALVKDLDHRALVESDLAGAAKMVFQWCVKNDLACEIRRGFGGSFTLVAKPK